MAAHMTDKSKKRPTKAPASKPKKQRPLKFYPELLPNMPDEFSHLAEQGYQVVPNVLPQDVCSDLIARCWQWLADMRTGIVRDDPATWRSPAWPASLHGIMQHSRTGHAQWVWDIRQDPRVAQVFARLWGCDVLDLIVSYDAICIMKPPELTGGHFRPSEDVADWIHTDQSPAKLGRWCIQGLITLEDMDAHDGTLAVYKEGHKHHKALFAEKNVYHTKDWHKFTDEELIWLLEQPGVGEHHVSAPAGSLVLWDSRVPHCAIAPAKGRPHPRFRYAIYVCMMPRRFANAKMLAKRAKAFQNMRLTNHWPITPKLFPEKPRNYGGEELPDYSVAVTSLPKLTPLGYSLAGAPQIKEEPAEEPTELNGQVKSEPNK